MKKFLVFFVLFIVGCSNNHVINCSYIDYSSIYGTKKVIDKLVFRSDTLVSFKRNINISVNDNINIKNVYKSLKLEGKSFHNVVKGKYKVKKSENSVNLVLKAKSIDNLIYIGIDSNDTYDNIKTYYSDIGFSCK